MTEDERKDAIIEWLKIYTWIQVDGSLNLSHPRVRPVGLTIDPRELDR